MWKRQERQRNQIFVRGSSQVSLPLTFNIPDLVYYTSLATFTHLESRPQDLFSYFLPERGDGSPPLTPKTPLIKHNLSNQPH